MRRVFPTALLVGLGLCLLPAPLVLAKFGITKTRVLLPRLRPPDNPPMADTVAVEVRSGSPEVTGAHVSLVRSRLELALSARGSLYRIAERARDADASVRVAMDALRAEVRDEIRMERRRVKIGERQVWNEKKKKYETEDVYADRDVPVSWRIAEGSIGGSVEVDSAAGSRPVDAGSTYHQEFKLDDRIPPEATTEEALKRFLVSEVGERAVAAVTFAPDPVEALLAVNGELKDGNKFAEAGLFDKALEEWSRRTYKGDTEAARLHNVGVAHEALAYRLPSHDPEHRSHLQQAQDFYNRARTLDTDEKYFRDPVIRIETSLSYAESAARLAADLQRFKDEAAQRRRAHAAPPASAPAAPASAPSKARVAAPPAPPPKGAPAQPPPPKSAPAPAGPGTPLRNGSFESSLAPWTLAGKGAVVEERGRGRVLEVVPGAEEASVRQPVAVDVVDGHAATLSLDYKVTSGDGVVRAVLTYADAGGRERVSTLQVTGGEGPGGWSPWTGDVASLRPRPSRVKEVRIVVEGGTVRLDNVALTVK